MSNTVDAYRTMLVRSTDAGRSWQFHATVAYDPDSPHPFLVGSYCGYCEPSPSSSAETGE